MSVRRIRRRTDLLATFQRDHGNTREALEVETNLVSACTGVPVATAIVASTCRGLSATKPRLVTSPTRIPLNSTAAPTSSPETDPSNWT